LLSYSQKIVIIPGYGLAVAQAQHIAQELDELLEKKELMLNMPFIRWQDECPAI
jgi:NAD/NADP transhydrogenase beta subunit